MKYLLSAALLMAALLGAATPAAAHGHITVGNYELVIGFRTEPAYQGEPNGLDLRVTDTTTNEPVSGLAETLRAEIIRGSQKRELTLRPVFGQEGAYTADVLPSEAGDYTWRIFGTIGETPVDVSMTSSPDTFNPVSPKGDAAFPAPEPTAAELRAQAESARRTAQIAMGVGGAGALLGLAGIILGLRSRRSA